MQNQITDPDRELAEFAATARLHPDLDRSADLRAYKKLRNYMSLIGLAICVTAVFTLSRLAIFATVVLVVSITIGIVTFYNDRMYADRELFISRIQLRVEELLAAKPSQTAIVRAAVALIGIPGWSSPAGRLVQNADLTMLMWTGVPDVAQLWDDQGRLTSTGWTRGEYADMLLLANEHTNLFEAVEFLLSSEEAAKYVEGLPKNTAMPFLATAKLPLVLKLTSELVSRFDGFPAEEKLFCDITEAAVPFKTSAEIRDMANVAFLTIDR